jgi:hypothetical protein
LTYKFYLVKYGPPDRNPMKVAQMRKIRPGRAREGQ